MYQNIAAGSEYDVIVGVAATSTSARIVMANAAPVKTFIPGIAMRLVILFPMSCVGMYEC